MPWTRTSFTNIMNLMNNTFKKARYIDIFAGCGGMSLGLCNSGWEGFFAVEKDKMAFGTLKHNLITHFDWPDWLPIRQHDIRRLISSYRKELRFLRGSVDLVVGGPPCQGFSMAGRRKSNDKRNKLVDSYISFIDLVRPKFLFFENVYGFTTAIKEKTELIEKAYSDYVVKELGNLGYNVAFEIIDFSEFGVPQRRKRFILVGVKNGGATRFFGGLRRRKKVFLSKKNISSSVSAKEAISDLEKKYGKVPSQGMPSFNMGVYASARSNYQKLLRKKIENKKSLPDSHRFTNHSEDIIRKFRYILKNAERNKSIDSNIKTKFNIKKRNVTPLAKDKPSPTLTTLPDDYIHYSEPRILTVREYARLQSFDDSFEFTGKYTTGGDRRKKEVPRYTQIGNAIPPLFGELAGEVFLQMREQESK